MSKKIKISESKLLELVTEVQKNLLKEYDTNEYENNPANFDVPLGHSKGGFSNKEKEKYEWEKKNLIKDHSFYLKNIGPRVWDFYDGYEKTGIQISLSNDGKYYIAPSYEAESERIANYFQPNGFEEAETMDRAQEIARINYFHYLKRTNESKSVVGKKLNEQKQLVESIVLSENVIDKFKEILRSGLVTAAVVTSLLAAPGISAAEKGEIKNLAVKSGIELKQDVPQKTLSTQVVKVNGAGKSMDQETAKKMAISNARNQGALKVSEVMGGQEFNITNMKIENVKFQQDPNGTYFCAVQISMEVTPQ